MHDRSRAGVGGLGRQPTKPAYRRNELQPGFVKDGDRWQVTTLDDDGSIEVKDLRHRGLARLPAAYVERDVELGYAATAHRVHSATINTAHVLVTDDTTRENPERGGQPCTPRHEAVRGNRDTFRRRRRKTSAGGNPIQDRDGYPNCSQSPHLRQSKYVRFVELFVDPDDARPLGVQLYDQLRGAIVEGQLTPGDRLGATRSVDADLQVSRSTVTEAYNRLVAEGYAEGHAGGGTVVSTAPMPVRRRRPASALAPTARAAAVTPFDIHPSD